MWQTFLRLQSIAFGTSVEAAALNPGNKRSKVVSQRAVCLTEGLKCIMRHLDGHSKSSLDLPLLPLCHILPIFRPSPLTPGVKFHCEKLQSSMIALWGADKKPHQRSSDHRQNHIITTSHVIKCAPPQSSDVDCGISKAAHRTGCHSMPMLNHLFLLPCVIEGGSGSPLLPYHAL